jgi:hypothetical protein
MTFSQGEKWEKCKRRNNADHQGARVAKLYTLNNNYIFIFFNIFIINNVST